MHVLQKLDELTIEEARMAAVEARNTFHDVGDKVMGVNNMSQSPRNNSDYLSCS
jgi:hypothetical protein